jgi:hypothetical protein
MRYGYLHTANGDLLIQNGDFAKGDNTNEIVQTTLLQVRNDDKLNPTIGVGIRSYLGGPRQADLPQEVKEQLRIQGINVRKVNYDEFGNIDIAL